MWGEFTYKLKLFKVKKPVLSYMNLSLGQTLTIAIIYFLTLFFLGLILLIPYFIFLHKMLYRLKSINIKRWKSFQPELGTIIPNQIKIIPYIFNKYEVKDKFIHDMKKKLRINLIVSWSAAGLILIGMITLLILVRVYY